MSLEQRLAEAVRAKTEATVVPSFDAISLQEHARRRARPSAAALVVAAVVVALVGAIGGLAILQRAAPSVEQPAGPVDGGRSNEGIRAFLDPDGGYLHLDGRRIELAAVPGLAETGLAFGDGVVYQTPDQEVRIIDRSGRETVLAAAMGPPPAGFTPSVAYDAESDVVVALRLTGDSRERAQISAYAASTGDRIVSSRMFSTMFPATGLTLAGATDGVAALNHPGDSPTAASGDSSDPHVFGWAWATPDRGVEWRRGLAMDLANGVVLVNWRAGESYDPGRIETGFYYVDAHEGERLDPTGAWRVDETWQTWGLDGPVERSTSSAEERALPLLAGSHISLAYDTDGSVLAAVASYDAKGRVTRLFDCDRDAEACEPIGKFEGADLDRVFLTGAKP